MLAARNGVLPKSLGASKDSFDMAFCGTTDQIKPASGVVWKSHEQ
jgi:hypothetical protein